MHESTLAMNILEIVVDQAARAQAPAVLRVDLCVGEFAGVEATTLVSCFDMLAEGTLVEKARLEIERIPATGICNQCGAAASRQGRFFRCPVCETSTVRLVTGREMYVKSIEVENPSQ
jgi:hydrogenase nickel incorporation protein HypA/HybF